MAIKEVKCQLRVSDTGEIKMVNKKEFEKQIKELFSGQTIIGEFRKVRKQRSVRQNSFYYAVTIPEIIESLIEAGYSRYEVTPSAVNGMLERMFLTKDIPSTEFAGEYITITREAKELTVGEWMDYTADITKWAAEFLNTVLSVPLEQKEIDLL